MSTMRARPMPPEERRAALLAATIPLVVQHGRAVTTRQIADAAGVAEGTIFRVFPTKDELVEEAIAAAVDPAPVLAEVEAIDAAAPLRDRVLALTEILQRRFTKVFNLFLALGNGAPPGPPAAIRAAAGDRKHPWPNDEVYQAVVRVFEPDCDDLRYPPGEVAALLRLITFAGTHPLINDGRPLEADRIVSVLLDGVCQHITGDDRC